MQDTQLASRLGTFTRLTVYFDDKFSINRKPKSYTFIVSISDEQELIHSIMNPRTVIMNQKESIYGKVLIDLIWMAWLLWTTVGCHISYPSEIQNNVTTCERVYFELYALVNIFFLMLSILFDSSGMNKMIKFTHSQPVYDSHVYNHLCHLYIRRMLKIKYLHFSGFLSRTIDDMCLPWKWYKYCYGDGCINPLKPATNGITHVNWDHWVVRNNLVGQRMITKIYHQ